jgi:predicted Abi (CAAX) family protease
MANSSSPFLKRPSTQLGLWAVGLAIAFIVMSIVNSAVFMRLSEDVPWRQTILPFYGIFMMLCGLATFVVGLIAIIRNHERSWLVWLTILPGASALLFVLGEFLLPH